MSDPKTPPPRNDKVIDVESINFTPNNGTNNSSTSPKGLNFSGKKLELVEIIYISDDDEDDKDTPLGGDSKRQRKNEDRGESSNSTTFDCEICAETKTKKESFTMMGCLHSYCTECVVMYVESCLGMNVIKIECPAPDCIGSLELEGCRDILPKEIFDRWGDALCEAMIDVTQKFYCPFKDCSALMIKDQGEGEEVIKESECLNCNRLFCAQCKVPWHDGIECEEFQKLNKHEIEKEEVMMKKLAENENWKRCPKCQYYVEKADGCLYMRCRCGHAFCYNCGSSYADQWSHFCNSCRH